MEPTISPGVKAGDVDIVLVSSLHKHLGWLKAGSRPRIDGQNDGCPSCLSCTCCQCSYMGAGLSALVRLIRAQALAGMSEGRASPSCSSNLSPGPFQEPL